jgi:hypothetical protein
MDQGPSNALTLVFRQDRKMISLSVSFLTVIFRFMGIYSCFLLANVANQPAWLFVSDALSLFGVLPLELKEELLD